MDALELALKCSSMLMRSMSTRSTNLAGTESPGTPLIANISIGTANCADLPGPSDSTWNESDSEKNFKDHGKLFFAFDFCIRLEYDYE